jgi:hypothetical protein
MSKGRECLLYQVRVTQKSVLVLFEHAQEGWRHKGERVRRCRAWKAEKDVAVATEKEATVLHSSKDGVEAHKSSADYRRTVAMFMAE